ncbi:hypothetical protein C8Q75DRAFT_804163 [Abortiporus biennis]|nr:hypothetical protein C8Q75DRAFT_804163 [Abortiporus biennis]
MNRENNSSWDSELVEAYSQSARTVSDDFHPGSVIPMEYTWTPPTPALDSDQSSSFDSTTDLEELPEIPFISAPHSIYPSPFDQVDALGSDSLSERTFWSSVVRPNHSKSSSDPSPILILGQTNRRVISPSRRRSSSVSSTASSRSKPAPARSILSSSSSSIRTRKGRSPASVKFLDMPTIHYEDDEDDAGFDFDADEFYPPRTTGPTEKNKTAFGLGFIRRLFGSGSNSSPSSSGTSNGNSKGKNKFTGPTRPTISGPFPLDAPRPMRRSLDSQRPSNASLRSVRSNSSMRSIRSASSRLQNYWGRLSGKDP